MRISLSAKGKTDIPLFVVMRPTPAATPSRSPTPPATAPDVYGPPKQKEK